MTIKKEILLCVCGFVVDIYGDLAIFVFNQDV